MAPATAEPYTLYWARRSGVIAPQVLLEEIGAPYRKIVVDMAAGAHRAPDFLAVNPLGQTPALRLPGGAVVTESAAMMLVIAEERGERVLTPAPGDADRPAFLRWLTTMATSVYMTLRRYNRPGDFTDGGDADAVFAAAKRQLDDYFDVIETAIAGAPFFLPRGFSALDIYLTMLVDWRKDVDALLDARPALAALYRATHARESYARVMREHA